MGGIGVVALSTVFGGVTGYFLAMFLIWEEKISKFEGGQGLFLFAVLQFAIGAGFVVGLLTVLIMDAGFRDKLLRSGEILAGLAVAVAIASVLAGMFEDKGPKIDGSPVMLEVEMRCWPGWTPSNALKAGHAGALLEKASPADKAAASGNLDWKNGHRDDGRWVLAARMPVRVTHTPWYVLFYMGKVEITMEVRLPKHPSEEHLFWSEWTSKGVVKAPNPEDLEFRYRLQKGEASVPSSEGADEEESRRKKLETLATDAPVREWTPLFESWGRWRTTGELSDRALQAIRGRPLDLVPLLESPDFDTARHAVYAAAHLQRAPAALVRPVGDAGRWIGKLIVQARAQLLPDDPDEVTERQAEDFYRAWIEAAKGTGEAGAVMRRKTLDEVKAQLDIGEKDETLQRFCEEVEKQRLKG